MVCRKIEWRMLRFPDTHFESLWFPLFINNLLLCATCVKMISKHYYWLKCIIYIQFSSVQFSLSVVSDSLRPHELQHTRPPCPSPTPGVHSNLLPSSPWCHPAISSSVVPFSPAPDPSQHQSLFQWVNSSHEVAKVLEFQLQHHSFQRAPRADLL